MNAKGKGILVCSVSLLLLAYLTGCSTFSTTTDFPSPDQPICGIPYYLPLGRVHIVGSMSAPSSDTTNSTDAQKSANKMDNSNTEVSSDNTDGSNTANGSGQDNPQKPKNGTSQYNVAITTVFDPDPSCLYYLKKNADYLYDDKISLSVNSKYLLSSSSADSKDETAAIISTIVSSIPARTVALPTTPTPFDVTFDPRNPTELRTAYKTIQASHLMLSVMDSHGTELTTAAAHNSSDAKAIVTTTNAGPFSGGDGIAFRLPTIYTITVTTVGDVTPRIATSQSVVLPNKNASYFLDSTRMPFSEKTTQLTFSNGMLTTFAQSVPSPILGFVGIPKSIITAVLPIPTASTPAQGTAKSNAK